MANPIKFDIYIGKSGTSEQTPKPVVIPERWKPILALAYAYTTYSINNSELNFAILTSQVNEHENKINNLENNIAALEILDNDDFIEQINNLSGKIDKLDPDLLKELAYAYTLLHTEKVHYDSYTYSYVLYEDSICRSYDYTNSVKDELQYKTNSLNQYVNNEFIKKTDADEKYAYKDNIPTKVSQLENDELFITHSALDNYTTYNYVDKFVNDKITDVVDTAPQALDTLKELANALNNNENFGSYVVNELDKKANISEVQSLIDGMTEQKNDIPIYDSTKIQELTNAGQLPDKYIDIDSGDELLGKTDAGNYLDIIFSTLRALQQEVTKIKNTFNSGIMSLINEDTHMSEVVNEYSETDEEEPLWAVDPNTLTEISGAEFYLDTAHTLTPTENVTVSTNKLVINGVASWNDNRINLTSGEPTNYLHDNSDAKQYVYITSSTTNIQIQLTNYSDDSKYINIDLSRLNIPVTEAHKYNILLCLSRSVKTTNNTYAGENFVYIIVSDYFSGEELLSGYINNGILRNTLQEGRFVGGTLEERRYYISKIDFTDLELYRMTFYSKFQEFNSDVQPSVPLKDDTYSVAHITIRSVQNIAQLKKIKDQLLENELVYNDSNNCIYIIKNNEIKLISGGSNIDPSDDITGMEKDEIISWLAENGIIVTENGGEKLSFNNVGDITFINQLNEKFKFEADSEGKLHSTKINDVSMIQRVSASKMPIDESATEFTNTRGFIGTLREYELNIKPQTTGDNSTDMKLNSDRIKIGNIYAPFKDSQTYGCTHAYIELENTSNIDYPLDGCYIHFARRNNNTEQSVDEYSLPLSGIIPAGGTYLIRCKKYSDIEQANTFIDVDSFDIEWITADGELLDPYLGMQNTFLLTYGCPGKDRDSNSNFNYTVPMTAIGTGKLDKIRVWHPCYIDSVSIIASIKTTDDKTGLTTTTPTWEGWNTSKGFYSNPNKLDALYKTTFELDPAKQAYQGLNAKDSSRVRSNTATDYQTVYLQKEYIEFPKTAEKYPVAMYKPMASYLHKNVTTDKTKLNMERPNMVTSAFGIDMLTTRCFNWVSAGNFDEYIWIRIKGTDNWIRFESYKERTASDTTYSEYYNKLNDNELSAPYRKEFTYMTNNAVYARIHSQFPGSGIKYTAHKCIIKIVDNAVTTKTEYEYIVGRADKNLNPDNEHISDIMTFTLYPSSYEPRLYQTTDQQGFHWIEYQTWAAAADYINNMINEQSQAEEIIPVVLNTGDATQNGTRVNEWLDYYNAGKNLFNHLEQMSIVGNNDLCDTDVTKLGTGDDNGKSNGFYHHAFYCYEVSEKLNNDTYPTADTDPIELLNNKEFKYLPLVKGNDDVIRYIPSFYWFGNSTYTFMMMNSELTYVNCGKWFKRTIKNDNISDTTSQDQTVNLYTGWSVPANTQDTSVYDDNFTTIYTMLYNIIKEHKENKENLNKISNLIVACHEMPFTVVTAANLKHSTASNDRSLNGTSLVGSHMNKLNNLDYKSNYWFSRLLEYFNVKFCYGGHKHTYAITNELRENYIYYETDSEGNTVKKRSIDGKMSMENTLKNDTAEFSDTLRIIDSESVEETVIDPKTGEEYTQTRLLSSKIKFDDDTDNLPDNQKRVIALSKFPLMNKKLDCTYKTNSDKTITKEIVGEDGISFQNDVLFPYYGVELQENTELGGVIYLMCQATGFKLKSNKELPGPNQKFSFIIPKTTVADSGDTPSKEQLQPMFTEIHPDEHKTYLMRLKNIQNNEKVLSQTDYGTKPILVEYLYRDMKDVDMYGGWTNEKKPVVSW